jgi:hypothetical protein
MFNVDSAINTQNNYNNTLNRVQPYVDVGTQSINPLITAMGYGRDANGNIFVNDPNNPLQQRFSAPTADEAAATPGYQFTLNQGLQAVQNSAAARGLGSSGAALRGAADYASGLANSTYNDVYSRALSTFNANYSSAANNVNRLQGLVSNGQNAALGTSAAGSAASNTVAGAAANAGNALAGGMVGSAAANASGLNSLANGLGTYALMSNNANTAGTYRSGLASSAIGAANQTSDPIAALNASQGWTP